MSLKPKYPVIVCADGFRVSVQASQSNYCEPRDDTGPYTHIEAGFPSDYDFYLNEYAEDPDRPSQTVYGWVPVHVIRMCIDAHGGMVAGELPPVCPDAWGGKNECL